VSEKKVRQKSLRSFHKETQRYEKAELFMLMPFLALFTLFTIIPVASSLFLSLTDFDMLQIPKFVGFDNYIRLFVEDDVLLIAIKNTLIFAFVTGPISYFLALFFAWVVNELNPRIRAFVTLLLYAPTIAGNMFIIWTFIFSGDSYGIVNGLLMKVGVLSEPVQWLSDPRYNLSIIILVQLWISLGIGFLSFIAGLQSIDRQIYEAGSIDGIRNRFQEFTKLTVPSMGPQLLFGAVMQISASFSVGAVSSALAGFPSTDYSAHTVILHIQDYGILRFEMGYASAIATGLFVAMLVVQKFIKKVLSRYAQ
jgi:multiple sugar transport system permease protein